jgi:DNA-binding MarR family transcriptional regulator
VLVQGHPQRQINLTGAWALAVVDAMAAATEEVAGKSGSAPAALVLLATFPRPTIDTLGQALTLSHSGATRLVDRLEDQGWIQRRHGDSDGDRRAVQVELTRSGKALTRRILAARNQVLERMLSPLSPAERDVLDGLLAKLLESAPMDRSRLRRMCRLCDHGACLPCPVLGACEQAELERIS